MWLGGYFCGPPSSLERISQNVMIDLLPPAYFSRFSSFFCQFGRNLLVLLSGLMLWNEALCVPTDPPPSLREVKIPDVPGLLSGKNPIVTNPKMAIALGKAFFWDTNLGSDGIACGTCHFHAGADGRIRNQLGLSDARHYESPGVSFSRMASGRMGSVDYTPVLSDFPFTQFEDPSSHDSPIKFQTDQVLSSAGTFRRHFQTIGGRGGWDDCRTDTTSFFKRNDLTTRQSGQRNAPTVINAVFNFRNFWDGRANNLFNGQSPWGARDPFAGVWEVDPRAGLIKRRILLKNASLASQAVAPIINDMEMACVGRGVQDVARKVLSLRALQDQEVSATDSVLAELRAEQGLGLAVDYSSMIRKAFSRRFWESDQMVDGTDGQLVANFAFFFGLSVQLYESTLISDQAPFDSPKDAQGYPKSLTEAQRRGQDVFISRLCISCHSGPTFTLAALPAMNTAKRVSKAAQLVDRMVINGSVPGTPSKDTVTFALFDRGFANTSVVPTAFDLGLGGTDPYGNSFAFSEQYTEFLEGRRSGMADPVEVYACDFLDPFTLDYQAGELTQDPFLTSPSRCRKTRDYARVPTAEVLKSEAQKPGSGRALKMVNGAFKIASLRNVELTGPYMHTGGMKSLEEVLEFYNRAGNVNNVEHFATLVVALGLSDQEKSDLIEFLKSLTDERVRMEKQPFDHPGLTVPVGIDTATGGDPFLAKDRMIQVPAVGREGRPGSLGPLQPFEIRLQKLNPN